MEDISFRIKWNEELFWAYRRFCRKQMKKVSSLYRYELFRRFGAFGVGLLLCIVFVSFIGGNSRDIGMILIGFIFGFWLYYAYSAERNRRDAAEELERMREMPETTVEVGPGGVRWWNERSNCKNKWSEYTSVEEFDSGLVLWCDDCQCGTLVPDSALPSGIDRSMARRMIEQWRSRAT